MSICLTAADLGMFFPMRSGRKQSWECGGVRMVQRDWAASGRKTVPAVKEALKKGGREDRQDCGKLEEEQAKHSTRWLWR